MIELMHGIDDPDADLRSYIGWWAQPKLRGVRMVWDGERAWSRSGKPVGLPPGWAETMPRVPLDGEIYCGPNGERACASAIRFGGRHWRPEMEFHVFDLPDPEAGPWEERHALVGAAVSSVGATLLRTIQTWRVESAEHLLRKLAIELAAGGEGLILRRPGLVYKAGRTTGIVKVKGD